MTILCALLLACGCARDPSAGPAMGQPVLAAQPEPKPPEVPKMREVPKAVEPKPPEPAALTEYRFPETDAGRILAKTLPPGPLPPFPDLPRKEQGVRPLPPALAEMDTPFKSLPTSPPRYPLTARPQPRPQSLPERVPLEISRIEIERPSAIVLITGALTRIAPRDVNEPSALSILAKPVPDRASLEDPSIPFTLRSLISLQLPLRDQPVGFLKINLPDPFENLEPAKVKTPAVEDPNRSLGEPGKVVK